MVKEHEEPIKDGLKRRFVDDMNLFEVSIIDDRKMPCYIGTSIETRANKNSKTEYRGRTVSAFCLKERQIDYSNYEKILKEIKNYGT